MRLPLYQVLLRSGELHPNAVQMLVGNPGHPDPGPLGPLSEWMAESMWEKLRGLELISDVYPQFARLGDDVQADCDRWQRVRTGMEHEKTHKKKRIGWDMERCFYDHEFCVYTTNIDRTHACIHHKHEIEHMNAYTTYMRSRT